MASIGHIAVGMAVARAIEPRSSALKLALAMLSCSALALVPDLDVVGRQFDIRYGDPWGHRGASHSLVFCLALGALIGLAARWFRRGRASRLRVFLCAALVLVSHPLLDTLTDGGRGCALLWPFSDERYFAPWRPIPVSPIGRAYFSSVGLRVAWTELVMFFPLWLYALWPRARNG